VALANGNLFELQLRDDRNLTNGRLAMLARCKAITFFVRPSSWPIPRLMWSGVVECVERTELYRCSESQTIPRAMPTFPPVEPFKLADALGAASQPSTTLHLSVSNQSLLDPSMPIHVSVDDWHVVHGDFAHSSGPAHEFDIRVPLGTFKLTAQTYKERGGWTAQETVDVQGERWARITYQHALGEPERISLELSEQPISSANLTP
ncbi:MAG TPA: hypothetical protein VMF89_17920, partial [Polyangiales bacterium]|nr:hypothetical protein [Polyangiales bacterium]